MENVGWFFDVIAVSDASQFNYEKASKGEGTEEEEYSDFLHNQAYETVQKILVGPISGSLRVRSAIWKMAKSMRCIFL